MGSLVAALVATMGLVDPVGADPSDPEPAPRIVVPDGSGAQPAALVYGEDTQRAAAYAEPGALVVAGRDNYGDAAFRDVSAAGGSVLIYLDPVIDNPHGRYHRMLLRSSACGPAVSLWPGMPRANGWGRLVDFRVGSVVQRKLRCVMQTMVRENPHMAGWFLDDVGSRSWFPGIDWDSLSTAQQRIYRSGAIALTRTAREVADQHGLLVLVNGTWTAGSLETEGGGYPDPDQHGNAFVDGGVVENHDGRSGFFGPYTCSPQWAARSQVTQGRPAHFAITSTWEGLQEYVDLGCIAYVNRQPDYSFASPWSGFRDLGLPSGRSDSD